MAKKKKSAKSSARKAAKKKAGKRMTLKVKRARKQGCGLAFSAHAFDAHCEGSQGRKNDKNR
jgi:hypothetical protein